MTAPHIDVTDVTTHKLHSDHRLVIYRLRIDGKPWAVGTYNVGDRGTVADIKRCVAMLARRSPLRWTLGLQETGDRTDDLRQVLREVDGIELVHGARGFGRRKVSAIVPRGTLMFEGLRKLSDRTFVGHPGAGGPFTDTKYVLRLRQRQGGTVLRTGVVHFISSVDGKPTAWRRLRRSLHNRQVRRATAWAVNMPHVPSGLLGDFNTTPADDLLAPMRAAGLRVIGKPSHGGKASDRRAIDLYAHN